MIIDTEKRPLLLFLKTNNEKNEKGWLRKALYPGKEGQLNDSEKGLILLLSASLLGTGQRADIIANAWGISVASIRRMWTPNALVHCALRQAATTRRALVKPVRAQARTNEEARRHALVEPVQGSPMQMQSPPMRPRVCQRIRSAMTSPLSARRPRRRTDRRETPPAVAAPLPGALPIAIPRPLLLNTLLNEPATLAVPLVTPTDSLVSNSARGAPQAFTSLPADRMKKSWSELGYPDEQTAILFETITDQDTSPYERGLLITELAKRFGPPVPAPSQLAPRERNAAARTGTTTALQRSRTKIHRKRGRTKIHQETRGSHTVENIPNTHTLIHKSAEAKMKKKAETGEKLTS
jgi:hypothetical protein